MKSNKEGSVYDKLCRMLDGNLDLSVEISDSKIWFALEHPKVSFGSSLRNCVCVCCVLFLNQSHSDLSSQSLVCIIVT